MPVAAAGRQDMMRIVRTSEQRAMPWKNGGGVTYEVAVFPEGPRSLDAFDWRVSMAQVAADGPFSLFPGIDRSLAIVAGEGITLRIAGRDAVTIGPHAPPVRFSGDQPATATLRAGAVIDLNVMTRRTQWRHDLTREVVAGDRLFASRTGITMVIVATGELRLGNTDRMSDDMSDDMAPLRVRDALILAAGEQAVLSAGQPAQVFRIDLSPLTAADPVRARENP